MDGIKFNQKLAVISEIKNYCYLAEDGDLMELTEWSNGKGFDLCIDRKNHLERFSMTYGEFNLLEVLVDWRGENE
jgi:hypothetical protein